jgi:uncharacterized membrane protein YeaQ/YmgE (transglycosylase-associated protein family)
MVGFIIGMLIVGLIVGALARLLMPGRDPMGIGATILLGVVGALVGGFLWRAAFGDSDGVEWIGSILGAMLVLWLYRMVVGRRSHSLHA